MACIFATPERERESVWVEKKKFWVEKKKFWKVLTCAFCVKFGFRSISLGDYGLGS